MRKMTLYWGFQERLDRWKTKIYLNNVFLLIRSSVEGMIIFVSALGSALGALVLISKQYFEPLPMIMCGTSPIVASICVCFLPETFNLPFPDTIQDVERRWERMCFWFVFLWEIRFCNHVMNREKILKLLPFNMVEKFLYHWWYGDYWFLIVTYLL